MLAAMDDAIGRTLKKVRDLGVEENTLVLFYSDNGGIPPLNASLNTPLRGRKGSFFEGGIRVPFVISWPSAIPAGLVYGNPVMGFDMHATALAAAGLSLGNGDAPPLDGVDLLPYLTGKNDGRPHEALFWRSGKKYAARVGDLKLVQSRDSSPMLFDLAHDLGESTDLAAARPERFTQIKKTFRAWSNTMMKSQWTRQDNKNAQPGGALKANPTRKKRNAGLKRDILGRESPSPTHHQPRKSWKPGGNDINGIRMNGTEILKLARHKGRLFAATSMWMETDRSLSGCQVLIKEGAESRWKVDLELGATCSRLTALQSFEFKTDHGGKSIKPVAILLAAPLSRSGVVSIWGRQDAGRWVEFPLGENSSVSQMRGMGFHRDMVTGVDMVFAGVSGNKKSEPSLGMLTGSYNADAKGKLVWSSKPELVLPRGERFMEYAVCNGELFASSSNNIWKRKDGEKPEWKSVYYNAKLTAPGGIRGLVTVPAPSGSREALVFIANGVIKMLDSGGKNTIKRELDIAGFLSKEWILPVDGSLAGYNKIVHNKGPDDQDQWLIGFQCSYDKKYVESGGKKKHNIRVRDDGRRPIRYFASERNFLVRTLEKGKPVYTVRSFDAAGQGASGAVRTICRSPFDGEGDLLYLGGGECNGMPSHDTGWICTVSTSPPAKVNRQAADHRR
jgi:hypothetical protein